MEVLHGVRDSHLGTCKPKFGSMFKLWIKGDSRFEMNQHEVLMKSNQTSRGFYTKDCILDNATTRNVVIQNVQIKNHWWILNLERIQFLKPGMHSMLMHYFPFNKMNQKLVQFISKCNRENVSTYVSTLYMRSSHNPAQM